MKRKHLIWDLDGTLTDSAGDILTYLELSLQEASVDISAKIKPIQIGPPIDIMLKEAFPPGMLTDKKIAEVVTNYRRLYDSSGFPTTVPFKGIEEIISDSTNFTHYIVTNKPNPAADRIVRKLKWDRKIAALIAQYPRVEQRKPKSVFFAELIAKAGRDKSSFVGIGDVKGDCIAAKKNGITAIGVLWGAGTKEELKECSDELFDDVGRMHDFLLAII
ncbi:MAG: HAD hydrolase-like protein [Chitinispirillia bacterium]|nr:HAD hydrolase-like protein [Chitinispirillia bacterium]MCL2241449.1 HAD hydrolase-like protein [Chitinispirillia bacterium]